LGSAIEHFRPLSSGFIKLNLEIEHQTARDSTVAQKSRWAPVGLPWPTQLGQRKLGEGSV